MAEKAKQQKSMTKKFTARTDVQVITMVALYTLFAIVVVSQIYWKLSFNVLMETMEERSIALATTVDEFIDTRTFFEINTRDDMETELYEDAIYALTNMKNATGVLYLFTAKVNDEGEFVYVLDGLERHLDFRYPNDKIEEAIIPKMERALNNEVVMPTDIMRTDWGDIFIAYLPMHDSDGSVVGVLGIEFDATNTYATLQQLRTVTPGIAIILVVSAIFISIHIFKRITNPLYMDGNTQDAPTGLKNRNAYEVDLNNLIVRGKSEMVGVIVADINGVKEVNDRLGHSAGDDYIRMVADVIRENKTSTMVAYRTGGDEFSIFIQDAELEEMKNFVETCIYQVKHQKKFSNMRCSLACGYTIFDSEQDKTLNDTYKRADDLMYAEKRRQKEAEER